MATIAICVYPLAGPISLTRKLAHDLRERGHVVHFVGLADCQRHLIGESFHAVFTHVFPALPSGPRPPMSWFRRLRRSRLASRRAREFVRGLVQERYEGFDTVIAALHPDLLVILGTTFYAFLWELLAFKFGIPSVLLNDSLTGPEDSAIPPVSSTLRPTQGAVGRLKILLAWKRLAIQRWPTDLYARFAGWDHPAMARDLARAFHFPLADLANHEKLYVRVKAPEVVLMPEAFDFPHAPRPGRCYSSACVDLERQEPPFPWERLTPDRPVILCSLGTLDVLPPKQYLRFFRSVIDAFDAFADHYQLVLATGGTVATDSLDTRARHIVIVTHAPQVALLRRAAAMITHAGSNSVRECLTLGVPMLLYPLQFDQFGYTARAVFHGVGLSGAPIRRVTVKDVRRQLSRLLTSNYYRLQARRWTRECLVAEQTRSAAMFVEMFLPARPPRTERPRPDEALALPLHSA